MADGGEDDVGGIALAALEMAAAEVSDSAEARAEIAAQRHAPFDWSTFDQHVLAMIERERALIRDVIGTCLARCSTRIARTITAPT